MKINFEANWRLQKKWSKILKIITCSLMNTEMVFMDYSAEYFEALCKSNDLMTSVTELNQNTIQFKFEDQCNNDLIMCMLANLFAGLGGMEVCWDIFNEPITIY